MGFQVCRNYIDTTGDDAIAVAYFSASGVIADNVIFNAGQYVTYNGTPSTATQAGGGGIRINGRQTVTGNQIYNANLFFVCGANNDADLTANPNQAMAYGNVGKGIKPTVNNTTACILAKSCTSLFIGQNDFDAVGDNAFAATATNNGGTVRITTPTAHGFTVGNAIRFEDAIGFGAVGTVTAVTTTAPYTLDLTTAWVAGYSTASKCFPSVHGVRIYTDQKTVTGVVNNGSTQVRITTSTDHGYTTDDVIRFADAAGVTNGQGACTVITPTVFDIPAVAFSGFYTGGGVSYRVAAQSGTIKLRGGTLRNVEQVLALRGGAANIIDVEDVEVINFTYLVNPLNNPLVSEMKLNSNTLRNPRIITGNSAINGCLFYGGSATSLTVGKLELNDNEVVAGSFGTFDTPINFASITITRADALGNKLGGATTQFSGAASIPFFLFDGDWSEIQHAAGTAVVPSGANLIAVAHGLPRTPRSSAFTVFKSNGGVAVGGGGLAVDSIGGTNFTIRTDTNVTGNLSVVWRIEPMARPYINGSTGA
jgi:hypothetical protein